ncbi:MAG: hypothetical protein NTX47_07445 [Candidatus Omnitrophica bacterium]|nr:hypothetical protein [Candidatus Omnitrophota bacterium]
MKTFSISKKLNTLLNAHGDKAMADRFLKGGYRQDGYGVPSGSAINGSFAFEGEQGYYTEDGKKAFLGTVKSMRDFFERRKPIKLVIKLGIGGQHTPFQGIADIFGAQKGVKISGEYELGKDYEEFIVKTLKELKAGWDEVAVIPSSKSGSTDETMMVFVDIFYVLLKYQAIKMGLDGEKFAKLVLDTLHEINFINRKERPGKELFTSDVGIMKRISEKVDISSKKINDIFAKVLGNMFFETTDRAEQSRLSAFIRNSGLDKELGDDAPGFGAMFDNVGGRWTADLHMMTFLAYLGLDAEKYWKIRKYGISKVREGKHQANSIAKKIVDNEITDIALLLPDQFFWFGKSIEQNFNESIWQEGFANLIAIRESQWKAQEKYYKGKKKLIIKISDLKIPDFKKLNNQEKANALAELFTTFYGITSIVGNLLIEKALRKAGYSKKDVDLNNLDNPATKIVQENLYLRQPYVELGKGLLEARLKELQEKETKKPGSIEEEYRRIVKLAESKKMESSISDIASFEKAIEFAMKDSRKFVPFIYLEGDKFYNLRDYLISEGIEWVMQGTGDQHISFQQVLAQPQKYLPFIISFIPEKPLPGRPAIGFAKGYLHNISPNMVRDFFAEASYKALVSQGGKGFFIRLIDHKENISIIKKGISDTANAI